MLPLYDGHSGDNEENTMEKPEPRSPELCGRKLESTGDDDGDRVFAASRLHTRPTLAARKWTAIRHIEPGQLLRTPA